MKNGIVTIMRKEFARFFGNKRTAIATLFLPAVLIYVLYSFMGSAMMDNFSADAASPTVAVVNLPTSLSPVMEEIVDLKTDLPADSAKDSIAAQELDALLIFPEDFDARVAVYEIGNGAAPNVELYYNSTSPNSQAAYTLLTSLLDTYESSLTNKFDVNAGVQNCNLASDTDETAAFFSMMLPMLLMIFLFSGCMGIAPEAIAGEKERGTIATMLITPVGRNEIALGKIMALSVIALLSALMSTVGTILSLPKLMGGAVELSANIYGIREYLCLAAVVLTTVLLLVTLISIISAFAHSIREATTMVVPLMVLVMFVGITGMFGHGAASSPLVYLIPLYNSVQCMVAIFSFEVSSLHILITAVSNVVYAAVGVWVLTRLFHSEKVIFSK